MSDEEQEVQRVSYPSPPLQQEQEDRVQQKEEQNKEQKGKQQQLQLKQEQIQETQLEPEKVKAMRDNSHVINKDIAEKVCAELLGKGKDVVVKLDEVESNNLITAVSESSQQVNDILP